MVLPNQVVVRPAVAGDAEAIVAIMTAAVAAAGLPKSRQDIGPAMWREPKPAEARSALKQNLANENQRIYVAQVDDKLVGFVSAVRRTITAVHLTNAIVINEIEIHPDFRDKGISKKLLSEIHVWALETNTELIGSISGQQDRERNRFLAKLGFGQVGAVRVTPTALLGGRLAPKGSRESNRRISARRALRRGPLKATGE